MREGGPRSPRPGATLVAVGDELLLGQTVDTNGPWLGARLEGLGFATLRRWVVGDVEEEIRRSVGEGLRGGELVVVTGGLGPTPDDRTREAVAGLLGLPLELDEALVERLKERFRARGFRELPLYALAMAQVPRGGTVLSNPLGAAPGLALEAGEGRLCVLLPGIPREMRALFQEEVDPLLRRRFGSRLRPVHFRLIHTTGIPESVLAREVGKVMPPGLGPVSLAYLPDLRGVRIRLTARGVASPEEAEARFDALEAALEPLLASHRYRAPSGDLAEALGMALVASDRTVATGESCTGGLIAKRLTDHPGASGFFLGGVVAYSNEAKVRLLGVSSQLLEEMGAVSEEVALAMAVGAAARMGASAGIGVTGVAGPGGGTAGKPVGRVCYAAALVKGGAMARTGDFPGFREEVRERSAQAAMDLLLRLLAGGGR